MDKEEEAADDIFDEDFLKEVEALLLLEDLIESDEHAEHSLPEPPELEPVPEPEGPGSDPPPPAPPTPVAPPEEDMPVIEDAPPLFEGAIPNAFMRFLNGGSIAFYKPGRFVAKCSNRDHGDCRKTVANRRK